MLSTLHDTITTVGLFALLQIEFNLTTLAAILTIAGYSINDTVVIYDRVRETMRKYTHDGFPHAHQQEPQRDAVAHHPDGQHHRARGAVAAHLRRRGAAAASSIAMLWGIVVGTYSSLFIAAPLLYYIRPKRRAIAAHGARDAATADAGPGQAR